MGWLPWVVPGRSAGAEGVVVPGAIVECLPFVGLLSSVAFGSVALVALFCCAI